VKLADLQEAKYAQPKYVRLVNNMIDEVEENQYDDARRIPAGEALKALKQLTDWLGEPEHRQTLGSRFYRWRFKHPGWKDPIIVRLYDDEQQPAIVLEIIPFQ